MQIKKNWDKSLKLGGFITWQKWMPRTLFPSRSKGGDQHIIPIMLGTTSRTAPEMPDLAGRPTWARRMNKTFYFKMKIKLFMMSYQQYSHERQTVRRSRTCHRNAGDSGCCEQLQCSAHAHLWLDKYLHWPVWQPWHFLTHRSPRWSTTGTENWSEACEVAEKHVVVAQGNYNETFSFPSLLHKHTVSHLYLGRETACSAAPLEQFLGFTWAGMVSTVSLGHCETVQPD